MTVANAKGIIKHSGVNDGGAGTPGKKSTCEQVSQFLQQRAL